jgi:hypothetical protein
VIVVGEVAEGGWWETGARVASVSRVRVVARYSGWVSGIRDGRIDRFVGLVERFSIGMVWRDYTVGRE